MKDKTAQELLGVDKVVNLSAEQPLISFIMPVYKDGDSVARAIKSIFDQDWPNVEVIAVNDGSPDNSKKVLAELSKEYPKLTVLNFKVNRGACVARNEGAKVAKGKYFAWLPADAFIYPGVVRTWVETLERFPEYDFLYGGYRFVDNNGNTVMNYWADTFEPYLLECANFIDGSFPIKAETYWRVAKLMNQPDGLWDPNVKSLQDWDFWLSVVKEGKGKGLYYKDIFFETTMPHPGGLSYDSHQNWLARTRQIKVKHGIPIRKICVTSPGAAYFAKYIAYLLDADYSSAPHMKDHDYDMIYLLGFYPSIAEQCAMVFIDPKFTNQYEDLMKKGVSAPLANAVKVVQLIGTDIYQMQRGLNSLDLKLFKALLNNRYDHVLTEYKETQEECEELGIETKVIPLPPKKFYEPTPFPKDFTVAVYAPEVNRSLYNYDLMLEVAKKLPKVKFKFYGNYKEVKVEGNVEWLGYLQDTTELIKNSSCLLRITTHDGLPQSVLEFLSAGRRVVFNHDFKYVNQANRRLSVPDLVEAIKEEMDKGLNEEAAQWIRKEFSREKFKKRITALLDYDPKKHWNGEWADRWLQAYKFYGMGDWKEIEPWVKELAPKSVIDVGCGEGQWSDKFDIEYLGIDISRKLIKEAQAKHPDKKFVVSSLEEFQADKKYDLAFVYTMFLHVPEKNMQMAVDSLKKVAKKAILVEPSNIQTKYYQTNHDYKKWFNIIKEKQLGPRVMMLVDLS